MGKLMKFECYKLVFGNYIVASPVLVDIAEVFGGEGYHIIN